MYFLYFLNHNLCYNCMVSEPDVPNYARETMSSSKKKPEEKDPLAESPLIPDDKDLIHKSMDSLSSLASSVKPYKSVGRRLNHLDAVMFRYFCN